MIPRTPLADAAETDADDLDLVQRSQNGDRDALETLVRRHQDWIYNIVLRMVYHPQEAEDATQEVLIKLLTKLSTFEGRSSFRTWLYRMVVNHVLNMKRARAKPRSGPSRKYGAGAGQHPGGDSRTHARSGRCAAAGGRSAYRLFVGHAALPGSRTAAGLHPR